MQESFAVNITCSVVSNNIVFGAYNVFSSSPLNSAADITITCSGQGNPDVKYDILLSTGSAGIYNPRKMFSGINSVNYNLYTTSARTIIWGNGTGGSSFVSDSYHLGDATQNRTYTVYGSVPALQNIPIGTYNDVITVTVNY